MLTPAQVISFLNHDDVWVRAQAVRYFHECPDPGALTADDLWAVIDARGETPDTLDFARAIAAARATEASLDRLLRALDVEREDSFDFYYQLAARDIDFAMLVTHGDRLLAHRRLLPHVKDYLRLRLRLKDEAPEILWDRLMEYGRSGAEGLSRFNTSQSDALIEALARHADEVGPWAMRALEDRAAAADFREIFAVRLLGRARYAPAIPALVGKLIAEEGEEMDDLLPVDVGDALTLINTPEVIERLAAFYPEQDWEARLFANIPLSRIKRPESEAALLKLLAIEEDDTLQFDLLSGLCDLGSLAALDASRAYIGEAVDDADLVEFAESVLATAVMNGVELPEASAWREKFEGIRSKPTKPLEEDPLEVARRQKHWRETGTFDLPEDVEAMDLDALDDDWTVGDDEEDEGADEDWDAFGPRLEGADDAPREDVIQPIRREGPKVGRNDPCPCGSGKKYKKCCLKD